MSSYLYKSHQIWANSNRSDTWGHLQRLQPCLQLIPSLCKKKEKLGMIDFGQSLITRFCNLRSLKMFSHLEFHLSRLIGQQSIVYFRLSFRKGETRRLGLWQALLMCAWQTVVLQSVSEEPWDQSQPPGLDPPTAAIGACRSRSIVIEREGSWRGRRGAPFSGRSSLCQMANNWVLGYNMSQKAHLSLWHWHRCVGWKV